MKKQLLFLSVLLLIAYTPYAASSAYGQSSIDDSDFMQSSIGTYSFQSNDEDESDNDPYDSEDPIITVIVEEDKSLKSAMKKMSNKKKLHKVSFAQDDITEHKKSKEIDAITTRIQETNRNNSILLAQKMRSDNPFLGASPTSEISIQTIEPLTPEEEHSINFFIEDLDTTHSLSLPYLRTLLKSGRVPGEYETEFAQKIQQRVKEVINKALITANIDKFKTLLLELNENDLEKLETELNNTKRSALPKVNTQEKITALRAFKAQ